MARQLLKWEMRRLIDGLHCNDGATQLQHLKHVQLYVMLEFERFRGHFSFKP